MANATTRAASRDGSGRRIKSVDNAVDILEALQEAPHPLGLSDLARSTGLSKTTVHHMLRTLASRRLVMQDENTAKYELGWALYEMGTTVVKSVDLARAARHVLDRLATQTGETALLGILDDREVLYLDRAEPRNRFAMVADAGRRGALHSTASGKVLLAFSTDRSLVEDVLDGPLTRYTEATVVDPMKLRRQLATVRQTGHGACWEEHEAGLCSIAVPLRDYTTAVIGSLTLVAPATRLKKSTAPQYLSSLHAARSVIEPQLGAPPDNQTPPNT